MITVLPSTIHAGTIPGFYREVFIALCPSGSTGREGTQSKIPHNIWTKCIETSSVSDAILKQVHIYHVTVHTPAPAIISVINMQPLLDLVSV